MFGALNTALWFDAADSRLGSDAVISSDNKSFSVPAVNTSQVYIARGTVAHAVGHWYFEVEVVARKDDVNTGGIGISATDFDYNSAGGFVFDYTGSSAGFSNKTVSGPAGSVDTWRNGAATGSGTSSGVGYAPGDVISVYVNFHETTNTGTIAYWKNGTTIIQEHTFNTNGRAFVPTMYFNQPGSGAVAQEFRLRTLASEFTHASGLVGYSFRPWSELAQNGNRYWIPADITQRFMIYDADATINQIELASGLAKTWQNAFHTEPLAASPVSAEAAYYDQTNVAKQPSLTTSYFNGARAVLFNGTDEVLSRAVTDLFRNVPAISVGAVYRNEAADVSDTNRCIFFASQNGSGGVRFSAWSGTAASGGANKVLVQAKRLDAEAANAAIVQTTAAQTGDRLGGWHVDYNTGAAAVYQDGVVVASNTAHVTIGRTSDTLSTYSWIGASSATAANFFRGALQTLWYTPVQCPDSLRQTLEGFYAHRLGMTSNLDSGHPYKTTAARTSAPAEYLYWNPSNESVDTILSDSNKVATSLTAGASWVKSFTAKSTGKWRIQANIDDFVTTMGFGFGTSSDLGSFVGNNASGWALWGNYDGESLMRVYANNASVDYAGITITTGDYLDLLLDLDAGKAWWRKNGTVISGDPVAGTGAMATFATGSNIWIAGDPGFGGVGGDLRLRTNPAEFEGSPVSGFTDGWPVR